ncbi:hypothetical protein C0W96_09915 [Photobacterium kishitanii]|uniref:hypothetical protein n=1 Tax=Photobacterium kishitanii TaxID=318456 RepID=UPI0005D34CAF|nr:hypothetical protein [Photobacterium kishitanii]KJG11790.1 hypothetical protein UB40_04205 [Photobacterium kishitanii]PSV05971.1 hypothetical protein C0W96_09915 [Photobacterium kishitanii]PSV74837.1 hypothetical protein C0W29_14000 [Photobacterium kishitanii]
MPFNKSILATVLISIFSLSGCNGGSNDSTTVPVSSTKTVTVIDGALENAQICIDLNDNDQCDKSDKILPQLTNKEGKVEVSLDDAKHSLIALIIAGQTKDSDEITPVTHSYSMITDANQSVITPFTTLAKVDPIALSEIEEGYGLTKQELLGDLSKYPKARILARSITPVMTNNIVDVTQHKDTITKIVSFIQEAENNDKINQLMDSRIVINNGKAEAQPLVNIANLLAGKTWFIASVNSDENKDSGVASINFKDANHLEFTDSDGVTETVTYTIDKDKNFISTDNENNADAQKFLYVSSDLIISVMNDPDGTHDLIVWSTKNLKSNQPLPVTASQFVGKTWYMLTDDSDNSTPEPNVFGCTFNSDSSLTVTEPNESSESFNAGSWAIKNNVLTINIIDGNTTYVDTSTVLAQTSDYIVIKNIETSDDSNDSRVGFNVLFNDKVRPMSILKQWKTISTGEVTTHVNVGKHKEITKVSIDKSEAEAKDPDAISTTIEIHNGQVVYSNSIFSDGIYYVMGYKPDQIGDDYYAYGPLKVTVTDGRIQNLDFTHAPIFHAVDKD